ncbi:MAG: YgjV family protein [Clostridiales bacterium]|nr:YgjV family protein [Clostridiales bacterium]
MLFILAQIFGFIELIITVIYVHFKSKEKIVMWSVILNLIAATQFFLLNAITGGIVSIINAIRCFVFYYYKKKDKKPSTVTLVIFISIAVLSGVITWQNIWSIIPIIATVIYTYGLWQDKVKVIRITAGIVGFGWGIYDIIVMAYVAAIQEFLQLASSVIALYTNRKKK